MSHKRLNGLVRLKGLYLRLSKAPKMVGPPMLLKPYNIPPMNYIIIIFCPYIEGGRGKGESNLLPSCEIHGFWTPVNL